MDYSKIIDISQTIENNMPIYPGNPETRLDRVRTLPGDSSALTLLTIGSHTGTHADGKNHMYEGGYSIDNIDLEKFIGKCLILDFSDSDAAISHEQLLEKLNPIHDIPSILLIKTKKTADKNFNPTYKHLSPESARLVAERGFTTIGIDNLSIDRYHSGNHPVHSVFMESGTQIIEGLDLSQVNQGQYYFIGFPLKIKDCDGAPVRAVLLA